MARDTHWVVRETQTNETGELVVEAGVRLSAATGKVRVGWVGNAPRRLRLSVSGHVGGMPAPPLAEFVLQPGEALVIDSHPAVLVIPNYDWVSGDGEDDGEAG